jgi:hypothetical protein
MTSEFLELFEILRQRGSRQQKGWEGTSPRLLPDLVYRASPRMTRSDQLKLKGYKRWAHLAMTLYHDGRLVRSRLSELCSDRKPNDASTYDEIIDVIIWFSVRISLQSSSKNCR